jgi:hypothetical protein
VTASAPHAGLGASGPWIDGVVAKHRDLRYRGARRELLGELRPRVATLGGHPWEHGLLLAGGPTGRLRGAAGRWSPEEMGQDWTPVRPERACEVALIGSASAPAALCVVAGFLLLDSCL